MSKTKAADYDGETSKTELDGIELKLYFFFFFVIHFIELIISRVFQLSLT